MNNKIILVCPVCRIPLVALEDSLRCNKCNCDWKMMGGIPCFSNKDFYWGEIPRKEMQNINQLAEERGWKDSLDSILKPRYPNIYDYVIGDGRDNFCFLLPITSKKSVLDLGSGWGTLSFALASRCARVVAVESVYERVKFCQIRKNQQNVNNLEIIMADVTSLPFPDSSFDFIILNGILEWVGLSHTEIDPKHIQKQFLKKIYNLLKPNGQVYIGIENRFGYNYFLGNRDHSGLKYTSLMPRRIANIYMKFIRRTSYRNNNQDTYRTYTYSYWEYRRLLKQSGFSKVEIFYVNPGYNNPNYFISLSNKNIINYYFSNLDHNSLKAKIIYYLIKTNIWPYLVRFLLPEFSIITQKGDIQRD